MSRMLNLAETLLSVGRNRQQIGRIRDALDILARLSRFRELPRDVAEETQARLGELRLGRNQYARAARHLTAALRYDPHNSRYRKLLGDALREQGPGHWERAATEYREAFRIDPNHVEALTAFGLLCVRLGEAEEGLSHLRRAVELSPDSPAVLALYVKGLRWAGRHEEAGSALRVGIFRNRHDSRFRQLWDRFRFRTVRREQLRNPGRKSPVGDGPVLLPFTRIAGEVGAPARPIPASPVRAASLPVSRGGTGRCSDQRNVQ